MNHVKFFVFTDTENVNEIFVPDIIEDTSFNLVRVSQRATELKIVVSKFVPITLGENLLLQEEESFVPPVEESFVPPTDFDFDTNLFDNLLQLETSENLLTNSCSCRSDDSSDELSATSFEPESSDDSNDFKIKCEITCKLTSAGKKRLHAKNSRLKRKSRLKRTIKRLELIEKKRNYLKCEEKYLKMQEKHYEQMITHVEGGATRDVIKLLETRARQQKYNIFRRLAAARKSHHQAKLEYRRLKQCIKDEFNSMLDEIESV